MNNLAHALKAQAYPNTLSTVPLREDYMTRILEVLSAAFGSQFEAKWGCTTPELMREVWGRKLHRYSDQPQAIKGALEEAIEGKYPPNLGEFYEMCQRRYVSAPVSRQEPVLEDNRTPDEKAEAVAKAKEFLAKFLKGEV